jgi:phosphohistidine phosphatase
MKLWIMRHGQAEPMAERDADRVLTPHGRIEVQRMCSLFQDQPSFEAILASPYARAQQTASIVRSSLNFRGAVGTAPWLTPDDDPRCVLDFLAERGEGSLLLVSHQPLVGQLISLLIEGHRAASVPMPTAALACLEADFPAAGIARLTGLWAPTDLES